MLRFLPIKKIPATLAVVIISGMAAHIAVASDSNSLEIIPDTSSKLYNSLSKLPPRYRTVHLNFSLSEKAPTKITLPLPEGGETTFALRDSGAFPPELAQRYPQIFSMKGEDAHGRQVRVDMSQSGMHAIVFDQDGTWQVQPKQAMDGDSSGKNDYITFRGKPKPIPIPISSSQQESMNQAMSLPPTSIQNEKSPFDNSHRTYRIAIAATSAYSQRFGGTVSGSLASVAEAINRVNAVFERDLGIHLTLAKDNDKIIFTDPASDPYIPPPGNDDFSFTRKQNIKILDQIIGKDNFDVGHLFELADGGGVTNNTVCRDADKADGGSGLTPDPTAASALNEKFIHVVTHEIAHQFGADHTFNGCARSADEGKTAFEPGSGSTMMSYAGECFLSTDYPPKLNPLHNLQSTKDAYFHAKSIEQVRAFISGAGAACGVKHDNPNRAPVIEPSSSDQTTRFIPAQTPFFLTGRARSHNPNARLSYVWEQIDLGPEQKEKDALSDQGEGPIFRSYPPTNNGTRIFPKLEAILGEEKTGLGEVYPATTRVLNFRLKVRDNLSDQASSSYIDRKIQVVATGQAFAVTAPTSTTKWRKHHRQFVRWDVAGTAQAPISCTQVRIDLSTDGGHTYLSHPLLASTPNIGRAKVKVPKLTRDVSTARIRVSCNGNLFFAVSPGNFIVLK